MKRPAAALAALALSSLFLATRLAVAAEPADLSLYVFDGDLPLGDADVLVDGQSLGKTNADGSIRLSLPSGARHLVVRRGDDEVLKLFA